MNHLIMLLIVRTNIYTFRFKIWEFDKEIWKKIDAVKNQFLNRNVYIYK